MRLKTSLRICLIVLSLFAGSLVLKAQTYTPVAVTGFNHDLVAETFPNAIATTDTVIDATNHVMYSQAFATAGGFAGGLPNSGTITDASNTRQFQMQPFNSNNMLFVLRNTVRSLTLTTPASYQKLSVMAFSTENASLFNVTVNFTDGTSNQYITNFSLLDWFTGTGNIAGSGYGRMTRINPVTTVQSPPPPYFYYVDINLTCADRVKQVQSLTFRNSTTAGFNAPFPNACVLAVSGQLNTFSATTSSVSASCNSSNGSASVSVTGNNPNYTYSWNSTPVQTGSTATNLPPGNYTVTITDASGCINTQNVVVGQLNSPTITTSATPSTICSGSSSQLSITATGGTLTSYNWTPGNLTTSNPTVSPAITTTYTVTGQDNNGCNYSQQVTVNVTQTPTSPVAPNVQVCEGTTGTLQVQSPVAGYTYAWYTAATGGAAVATGTSYSPTATTGTVTYYVEATNTGCPGPRTAVTLTFNPPPAPPIVPNIQVCQGSNGTFVVQGAQALYTYSWYSVPTGGTAISTGSSFTVTNVTSNQTYYVEASQSGCTGTRTMVTVTANPIPAAPTVPGITVCQGSNGSLQVQSPQAGYTYNWYSAAAGGSPIAAGTSFNVSNVTSTQTYYVDATNTGCTSTRTAVTVTMNPLPSAPVVPDVQVCQGGNATLQVQSPQAGNTYNWYTSAVGGTAVATGTSYAPTAGAGSQTYYVEATNGGCASTRTAANVTISPTPHVSAGGNKTINVGDVVQLNATASAGTYLWTPALGLSSATVLNPNANPSQTTTYTLTVTSALGCTASDQATITVLSCINPMEAFTPNGDGINDVWLISTNGCLAYAKVAVYNRYGNRVYENDSYKNDWDGKYHGKPLPDGTYYFIITYKLVNSDQRIRRGTVTILR